MQVLGEFKCFNEHVLLLRSPQNNEQFHVFAYWGAEGAPQNTTELNLQLREARVRFEHWVQMAICRLTLDTLYNATGLSRPAGAGKYGL